MRRFYVRVGSALVLIAALCGTSFASSKYPGYPFPFVSSVTPQAVVPGSRGFTLNVYGANFISSSVVNWNRQARQTTFISARQLRAQILESDIAQATAGYITVTNTTPAGALSTFASPSALIEVHVPTATISPGAPYFYNYDFPIVAADMRGDSVLDLFASTFAGGHEEMVSLTNAGDGSFTPGPPATYDYYGYGDVEFGDVNGDGKLDIVFSQGNYKYSNTSLQANLGNGNGIFTPSTPFGFWGGQPPSQFVLGDFNQDGTLDTAVASRADESRGRGGSYMPVFPGNGDGTFSVPSLVTVPDGPVAVVAGDFNGDGILDLVTDSLESASTLSLSIGNGDGTFQTPQVLLATSGDVCTSGIPLQVADFNNDGKLDLAICGQTSIGIMLGNGDGTFQPSVFYKVGHDGAFSFAVGDFNSDGNTDLVISQYPANNDDHRFSIMLGNGDGTFGSQTNVPMHPEYDSEFPIVTGDFNSDGLLDFVLVPAFPPFAVYLQK